MTTITTTELRTNTKAFIDALVCGQEVQIIHRSKIIGKIRLTPVDSNTYRKERAKRMLKAVAEFSDSLSTKTKKYTHEDYDRLYRQAMIKKHG